MLKLIGHLIAAALIFIVFFAIAWIVSWLLYRLNEIHAFPAPIFQALSGIEVWLTYADWGVCIIVLVMGTWRFVNEIVRGNL
ncbi:hypothetical protein GCM10009126_27280 [Rhodanobacter caeni]|uniref:Uncharacterized protein n=1 Tax=Rhodanobacter caeni TaxID=657654 RepID=A0ABN0USS8_9GAMM